MSSSEYSYDIACTFSVDFLLQGYYNHTLQLYFGGFGDYSFFMLFRGHIKLCCSYPSREASTTYLNETGALSLIMIILLLGFSGA